MRWVWVLLATVALAACQPQATSTSGEAANSAQGAESTAAPGDTSLNVVKGPQLKVGDVEQRVSISLLPSLEPMPANIKEERIEDARHEVSLVRMAVNPPIPEALPLLVTVKVRDIRLGVPVVVRVKLFANDELLATKNFLLGSDAYRTPQLWPVIVPTHLTAPTEELLARVEADALLMPEGTQVADVNPDTATAPADRTTTLLGNPVRITINRSGDAASQGS